MQVLVRLSDCAHALPDLRIQQEKSGTKTRKTALLPLAVGMLSTMPAGSLAIQYDQHHCASFAQP